MWCRCRNSLAKLLLDSSCAAAFVGPNTGQPRRVNSSTTPNVSGSSGPTTVSSGCRRVASPVIDSRLFRSAATHSASSAMPPFPGAQYNSVTRGDCRSFHTSACSRPPLPRTKTFISQRKSRLGVRRECCQTRLCDAGSPRPRARRFHVHHFKYALTREIKSSVNSSGESGPRPGCVMCRRM